MSAAPDAAPAGADLLEEAWAPLVALAEQVDEDTGWRPTELPGWTVRDLLWHLLGDAQRALVALHTPADGPADTDETTYWSHWTPGTDDAALGLRVVRTMASAMPTVRGIAGQYAETARAVLHAVRATDPATVVSTQGHVLTAGSLVHTLVVEAGVHHLDLGPVLPEPPAAAVLAAVRQVLDGLLGQPLPAEWDDTRAVLLGTGRAALGQAERGELGELADRFPLFG